jgi:hypothetical protein
MDDLEAALATRDLMSAVQTLGECSQKILRDEIEDIELVQARLKSLIDNYRSNEAEAAWERMCEDFHDGGNTSFVSLRDRQIEAMKLK